MEHSELSGCKTAANSSPPPTLCCCNLKFRSRRFWRDNCCGPALPVKVVASTAAGDAFNAAFAFALASGQSEFQAGRFATAAAAYSVTQAGAQPSLPTRAQVDSMSEQRP